MAFALPQRDKLGRRIVFYRPRIYSPSLNIRHDILRSTGVVFETLMEDEENQIRGCVHVVDASGTMTENFCLIRFNKPFLIIRYWLELFDCVDTARNLPYNEERSGDSSDYILTFELRLLYKCLQKMVPMRHKEFHATMIHPSMKFVLEFALSLMSEKLRKRVRFHSKLDDGNSIDRDLLPAEYGGKIPMAEMIESFKKELEAHRDLLLRHDEMNIRFELYPEAVRLGSTRSLKIPLDSPDEAFEVKQDLYGMQGIPGSFRKLEID